MDDSKSYDPNLSQGVGGIRGVLENPLVVATKPPVIFKFASALLSLIIYSCLLSAWYDGRCLFNKYNGICRFGSLSLVVFLICFAFLVIEILFSQISSFKVKRRIAIADVIISGSNTLFYLLLFVFLSMNWFKSEYPPFGHSINCCRVAILLSFLAIFALAACTGLAYVRYQSALDTSLFITEDQLAREQAQYYDKNGNYYNPQYPNEGANYSNNDQTQQQQYAGGNYMNYDGDINMN